MSPPPNGYNSSATPNQDEETKMRQALGLRDGARSDTVPQRHDQPRRGRHFVRDGEVPVVLLSNSREHGAEPSVATNRIEAAEAARRAEQAARERADRALHDALETIQHLRTQLAHAELSHGEALAAERGKTARAEAALHEAVAAREALEGRVAEMLAAQRIAPARREPPEMPRPKLKMSRKTPKEPRSVAVREQQPVKWWLASPKAKSR